MPRPRPTKREDPPRKREKVRAARPVVPEDLRVGDGVTLMQATGQTLACDDPPAGQAQRVLRYRYIPAEAGQRRRVAAVCLPFVLVRRPDGRHETLDLRRHHLARLGRRYTDAAFAALKPKKGK
ncbi:MAG: hypothetical protein AAF800_06715 [Planctomycetota bacterium]